jgi:hypothetical protein
MEGSSMKNGLYNGLLIDKYGDKRWYLNGNLHREDGPAIEEVDGTKFWYLNGERHREDGPAVINNESKLWYKDGTLHREDGPAVELASGDKAWYLNDKQLEIIPQEVLINYMKANNLTLAHLLTDPDPLIRKSASKYEWKEVA